ncbi:LysR family transcriptional regulator [Loktanella sp. F6476L]|uniref:LysR family transcriptional regulator n=1 Tax=Loktanella sp. F6476L TaxID=2926405 RepID=UPI001FF3A848|nr:LysR family transcriptional regulator [Loktanella sp. F6476L]MCK0122658.1 LysR family transcriptional regulator [Loktanella sp. F6476L]
MRINYDFLDLEAFLAVKDTASFHLASERLNLSQSSVTRRVRKLEEALGTQLFERTTRDVRPTLAAKRLQIRAEAILQEARETTLAMQDESAAYAYQMAQTVTLATIPSVIGGLVAPAISAFRAAGHNARIRVMDLAANEVAEAVAQGEADFGIGSIPMLEPVTDFTPLIEESMVLVLPPDHLLASKDSLTWHDLSGVPLILPARGTGNRLLIDEALARNETPVLWTHEVGRTTTALELVSQKIGVAVLPKMALDGCSSGGVVWRPIADPAISRPIGLLNRLGHENTASARAFMDVIVGYVRG